MAGKASYQPFGFGLRVVGVGPVGGVPFPAPGIEVLLIHHIAAFIGKCYNGTQVVGVGNVVLFIAVMLY